MKLARKELADLISSLRGDKVTVDQVRKNESAWGLSEARGADLNKRVVRYDRESALKALIKRGIISGSRSAPARSS